MTRFPLLPSRHETASASLLPVALIAAMLAAVDSKAAAQNPSILQQLNAMGANIGPPVFCGGWWLFPGPMHPVGNELLRTRGVPGDVQIAACIASGPQGSSPRELVRAWDGIAFSALDPASNTRQLFRMPCGNWTPTVIQLPGGAVDPGGLTVAGGHVYFEALTPFGPATFVSDGTSAGTYPVGEAAFSGYHAFNDEVFYAAMTPQSGIELYAANPTGSRLVKDIWPGSGHGSPRSFLATPWGLFFAGNNGTDGSELWKTDGTEAGTVLVADIRPGSMSSSPDNLAYWSDRNLVVFSANDGTNGRELHAVGANPPHLHLALDVLPGSGSAFGVIPTSIGVSDNGIVFRATGLNGPGLYGWDGTAPTATFLAPVQVEGAFHQVGTERLIFKGGDGSTYNPWVTDGTANGTSMLTPHSPGVSMDPYWFADANLKVMFPGFTTAYGTQPFVFDPGAWTHRLGSACVPQQWSGPPPELTATAPLLGNSMTFRSRYLPPGSVALLLLGFSRQDDGLSVLGCQLQMEETTMVNLAVGFPTNSYWNHMFAIPNNPALTGTRFVAQTVALDQQDHCVTNAILAKLGQGFTW